MPLHWKTVLDWMLQYEKPTFTGFASKKRASRWVLAERFELQEKARQWVRARARRKGKAVLKAPAFCKYINDVLAASWTRMSALWPTCKTLLL